jgi:adenylylsulfate kinase
MIVRERSDAMHKPHGWVIWLTGLPASGKTTLAYAIRRTLSQAGISTVVLDSDALRHILIPSATYEQAERDQFYARLVDLAVWLAQAGENVIIAATGSQRSYRRAAGTRLGSHFLEVWVRCPVTICRARDEKGLYTNADLGVIHNLPGADAVYEEPEWPDLVVDTDRQSPEEAARAVVEALPVVQGVPAICTYDT